MTDWLLLAFVDLSPSEVSYLGWQAHEQGRNNGGDCSGLLSLPGLCISGIQLITQSVEEWMNKWMNKKMEACELAQNWMERRLCAQLSLSTEGWIDKNKFLYLTFKALIFNPIPNYPILFPPLSKFRFSARQFGLLAVLTKHHAHSWLSASVQEFPPTRMAYCNLASPARFLLSFKAKVSQTHTQTLSWY